MVDGWHMSSNESGGGEVYVTRFPEPVGKWQVSTDGGGFPVWSRDGRELFYRGSDGTLMAVPIAAGSELRARCADPALQAAGVPSAVWAWARSTMSRLMVGFLINIFVERTSPPATVVVNWTAGR